MTDLKQIISELKLNYDTLNFFQNDNNLNIVEYFKEELSASASGVNQSDLQQEPRPSLGGGPARSSLAMRRAR